MNCTMSISRREFARLCGVSHTHINNLIREGKLPLDEFGVPIPQGFYEFESVTGRKLSPDLMGFYEDASEGVIEKIDPFLYELDLLPERIASKLFACETSEGIRAVLDNELQRLIKEHIDGIDDKKG